MEIYVGQRVKFIDPESFDPRIGEPFEEVRGRVLHADATQVSVLPDGKTFARWIEIGKVKPEVELTDEQVEEVHRFFQEVGRPLGPTP